MLCANRARQELAERFLRLWPGRVPVVAGSHPGAGAYLAGQPALGAAICPGAADLHPVGIAGQDAGVLCFSAVRPVLALRQHGRADRHRAGSGDFVCYGHRPDLPGAGAELARRPACLSADTAQAGAGLPRSLPIIDGLLTLFFVGGTRFSVRAAEYWQARTSDRTQRKRVLIAGAGGAGEMIVREMLTSPRVSLEPVGFVDDDKMKKRAVIHGVRVLGEVAHIPQLVAEYRVQEVIIAMPTAPGKMIRKIVALCEEAGVACRSMPGI